MLDTEQFLSQISAAGIEFYAGVPDSLLKDVCARITDDVSPHRHVIAANEGAALALAAGYYMATGRAGLVYLQNSGLGNLVNPLTSLTDPLVYQIPALLLIGWRGEPGVPDEPQHLKQGAITPDLLDCLNVPYFVLPTEPDAAAAILSQAIELMHQRSAPVALLVRKNIFAPYQLQNKTVNDYPLSREEAIAAILESLPSDAVVVSTTGMISREVYEYRQHRQQALGQDFLTVGSMGHCSQIALGIALAKPQQKVVVLDGDGALLMHMGSAAILGQRRPQNLLHVVLNNGAHDSVGGQPTIGFDFSITAMAKACGYPVVAVSENLDDLTSQLATVLSATPQLTLWEVRVKRGSRSDLGRPKSTPLANKLAFMERLSQQS